MEGMRRATRRGEAGEREEERERERGHRGERMIRGREGYEGGRGNGEWDGGIVGRAIRVDRKSDSSWQPREPRRSERETEGQRCSLLQPSVISE